ncbi:PAS domain S-box protein [Sideroxydans sp. CL21]|uniref:PAS domain S-box protein n=1 Tax=Sideroxydans sp. CL21 TaxID=2600596 RepID=UPI0012A82CAA|nr:PAS domain S-box protein [Sideroxydans sp. CL21]VVC84354.1 diguanylate cyclase/phosphodiesterase (GGDEF & EAL domains) with PAS/PAC sensor(s) [Sideroxydans sp. CL21]
MDGPRLNRLSKLDIKRIVLIYAVFAGLWIVLSDEALEWFIGDSSTLQIAQTFKGWFYVAVTSLLLYFLLKRTVERNDSTYEPQQYVGLVNWKPWQQYLFAATVTLTTLLLRESISISFGERPLLILFMFPVILSAAIGGFGPGMISTFIAAVYVIFIDFSTAASLQLEHSYDLLQLGFLIVNGLLVSILSLMLHEARHKSDQERKKALASLDEKSRALQLLDAITEGSTDAIFVKDVDGRYLLFNQAAARFVGKSVQEVIGKDDAGIFPPDQAALIQRNDREVMQDNRVTTFQENLDTKDGKSFFLATKGPLHDDAGNVTGVFGISRDITGIKTTEFALRRERDLSQRYLDTAQSIMVALDDAGRITMISRYGCELLGYRENELLDENWFKTCLPQPEGMETILPIFRRILAGDLEGHQHMENAVLCRDGSQRMISWRNNYFRNEAGNIVGTLSSGEDVTDRRKAEEALRASEETYRSLFEHMLNGFAHCRMLYVNGRPDDFIYLNVNDAFTSQTGLKDVAGRKVSEVIPGIREADPELFEKYGRVASGGKPEHFELFVQALDMWFAVSVYSPKPEHFVAVFDVVTERKKAELALRESEEQFRALVEQSLAGIYILQDGQLRYVNPGFAAIFGYNSPDALIDMVPAIELVIPQDREKVLEITSKREPGESDAIHYTTKGLRRDGASIDLEVYGRRYQYAGHTAIIGMLLDITARKQAQAQRDLFSDALRQSAHPLLLADAEFQITYVNPAFSNLFGYPLADVAGRHVSLIIPATGKYTSERDEIIIHLQESGNWSGEVDRLASDGSLIPTAVTIALIRGEGGKCAGYVASYLDLRPLREKELTLRKLSLAVEQSPESIYITDLNGNIEYVNESFVRNTGYGLNEIIGRNPRILHSGKTPRSTHEDLWQNLLAGNTWQGEFYNKRKDGSEYTEHAIISPIRQPDGRITHYVSVQEDITEKKRAEAEINRLAFYDTLTGLPNRSLLLERMAQTLAMTRRFSHHSAMISFNIDRFKTINDAGGQTLGDALLRAVSERLIYSMREGDVVARISGDEFGILLTDLSPQHQTAAHLALHISEKIHSGLREPLHIGNEHLALTACLGIALFPESDEDQPLDILRRANTALHHAKTRGRGQTAFFEGALDEIAKQRFDIERELHQAITADELRVFLQPQVDAAGSIVGAEALVRWQHPQRGLVAPGAFIPIAEESNLIVEIGNWVFTEVCRLLTREDMVALPIRIAVNISPRHFRQPDFIDQIKNGLASTGADPTHLTLEVTEGLVIDNINDVIAKMTELSAMGIHFSMDDFGTGYSSLSYLKRLPIHELKIDKSFIQDLTIDPEDDALVEAILAVAKLMHVKVVAEGVETVEQAAFLNLRGPVIHQGYLFGKPELAETVIANFVGKN